MYCFMQANQELEGERSQHSVAELTKKLGESEKKVQQLTLESTELQKQVKSKLMNEEWYKINGVITQCC